MHDSFMAALISSHDLHEIFECSDFEVMFLLNFSHFIKISNTACWYDLDQLCCSEALQQHQLETTFAEDVEA